MFCCPLWSVTMPHLFCCVIRMLTCGLPWFFYVNSWSQQFSYLFVCFGPLSLFNVKLWSHCILIYSHVIRLIFRLTKSHKVNLRIHHRGKLVLEHVKWYINGYVSEMNWQWDGDYMLYMDLESLIKSDGYNDIRCM